MEPDLTYTRLSGGRRVAVYTHATGSTDAPTVVLCHPAPGSGAFDPDPAETARRDLTLISVDRPGYGRSDPMEAGDWADVTSAAADIAAVLEERGGVPAGVAGWSAGGRVALALAALRPELVDRVVVLGTPAPNEAVQWIPPDYAAFLDSLKGLPADEAHAALSQALSQMVPADPSAPEALALVGAGEADALTLELPGARDRLTTMLSEAFRQGENGLVTDMAGYTLRPWGFEPGEVVAKTLLLYGDADEIGPRHAAWWQKNLSNARTEMVPKEGHLAVVPLWKRVLSHLAPGRKKRAQVTGRRHRLTLT